MSLTGAQVASSISATELSRLLDYGARLVRVFIAWAGPIDVLNAWSPEQWRHHLIDEHASMIERDLLPVFERYPATRYALNLLHPCGGFESGTTAKCFGSQPDLQWHIFDAWNTRLRYLTEHPQCVVADMLNEPAGDSDVVNPFYRSCANYIYTGKRVAISPIYGHPRFMDRIDILGGRTVWYEPHLYQPMSFTHQGIDGRPLMRWSRAVKRELEDTIAIVRRWQRRTKEIIYVGELGVSTFARESDRVAWFECCLDACKRHGWHWTAHCFGKVANVWDIETREVLKLLRQAWRAL